MLIDRPGLKFIGNQALLQQVDIQDKIQKSKDKGKTTVGAILQQGLATVKQTAKILGSTIAQVPVNGTGTHFVYAFRTDTYLQPEGGNQRSAFAQFFGAGGIEGAQYALRGEIVPGIHTTELTADTRSSKFNYEAGDVYLDRNETTNTPLPADTVDRQTKVQAESGTAITVTPSESGIRQTTASPGSLGISNIVNTGSYSPAALGIFEPTGSTYSETATYLNKKKTFGTRNRNVTKEFRVLLGDQGAANGNEKQAARRKNQYWFMSDTANPTGSLEVDQMNAIGVKSLKVDGNTDGRDLVKFRFHILTADGEEKVLYFRAYLDSFADNYTGQWNPVKYLGRAEDFQTYSGFKEKFRYLLK
jgi:hypothetical protein